MPNGDASIRPYTENDLALVRSLHERFSNFPMPDLSDPRYVVKEVAEQDGRLLGLGLIRLTSEVISIIDLSLPIHNRAAVVEQLLREGIYKSQKLGIDETHAFLTGGLAQPFAHFLRKRMGFVDCHGIPLTLRYR